MNDINIMGAGLYAVPMIELAIACGYNPVAIYDKDSSKIGQSILNVPIIGVDKDILHSEIRGMFFAIAIGNNQVRVSLFDELKKRGAVVPRLIHPTSYISPSATIGEGVYIQPHAIIWSLVDIRESVIISPSTVICHHTSIGKGCMIANLVAIGSDIRVGDGVFVGMGSTIMTGIKKIGNNAIIGAGAVVIKDVESQSKVVGVPAKALLK